MAKIHTAYPGRRWNAAQFRGGSESRIPVELSVRACIAYGTTKPISRTSAIAPAIRINNPIFRVVENINCQIVIISSKTAAATIV